MASVLSFPNDARTQAATGCCNRATLRSLLKHAGERGLAQLAPLARRYRALRSETLILAFHNVLPSGERISGEHSLHLPQRVFAAQLDELMRTHDVVPLHSIFDQPFSERRPRAAITFDDAYRGALTAGVHEVANRGLSATFFVAPGFVPDGTFWWDLYADTDGEVAPQARATAMIDCCGETQLVNNWATSAGLRTQALPAYAHVATKDELTRAAETPGIEFGSHTWSHCNLAAVDLAEVERQLTTSLDWLRSNFSNTVPWLSYPYGSFTPAVAEMARDVGYDGAVAIAGGWHRPGRASRYAVPRLNIPSKLTRSGFVLRTAGLLDK